MLMFIGICLCFDATTTQGPAALRNDNFPIRVTELMRLLSGSCWGGGRGLGGVVVGVWVEWWSGFGWSGSGRGFGWSVGVGRG